MICRESTQMSQKAKGWGRGLSPDNGGRPMNLILAGMENCTEANEDNEDASKEF